MTTGIQKFTVFALAILVSWIAGASVPPTWSINRVTLDVLTDDDGRLYYLSEGSPAYFEAVPIEQAQLDAAALAASGESPAVTEEFVSAGWSWATGRRRPPTTSSSRDLTGAGGRCCRPRWR